jgi:NAD-dependent deacetylase
MPDHIRNIVILTGAGVSAESGVATFRGPDGLWEGHRVEDVATPEAFVRDPALVHAFYDARRVEARKHRAQRCAPGAWRGSTSNGPENCCSSPRMSTIFTSAPARCGSSTCTASLRGDGASPADSSGIRGRGSMGEGAQCPSCGGQGWFAPTSSGSAKFPTRWTGSTKRLQRCDLFVSIGTSGAVYPAAGFVQTARYCGARTLEMNLEPSLGSFLFDESRTGRAGELVPQWVEEVLART